MIVNYALSAAAVTSALAAALVTDMRKAVLGLWICGISVGGLFLSMGAEMAAIIQWILSTITAVTFVFYAVMFGEYRGKGQSRVFWVIPSAVAAGCFAWVVAVAFPERVVDFSVGDPAEAKSAGEVGFAIADGHFLSLSVLGIILLAALVSAGTVARPSGRTEKEEE